MRRAVQTAVLAVLIAVPWYSRNPMQWSPSRIVQGNIPPPRVSTVMGDTWSFSAGDFSMLHPVAFAEQVVATKKLYLPLLTALALPLAMTLLLGRIFCSWLCPAGFLLELNQRTTSLFRKAGLHFNVKMRDFRYPVLTLSLSFSFLFAVPLISAFDPPHVIGRELMYLFAHQAVSLSGVGLLFGIFLFETLALSRACCSRVCPSGGGLSLLGAKRLLRIEMDAEACTSCGECDRVCPYGLMPMKLAGGGRFDWVTCDNCGLCRDECPEGAISYTLSRKGEHHADSQRRRRSIQQGG